MAIAVPTAQAATRTTEDSIQVQKLKKEISKLKKDKKKINSKLKICKSGFTSAVELSDLLNSVVRKLELARIDSDAVVYSEAVVLNKEANSKSVALVEAAIKCGI